MNLDDRRSALGCLPQGGGRGDHREAAWWGCGLTLIVRVRDLVVNE